MSTLMMADAPNNTGVSLARTMVKLLARDRAGSPQTSAFSAEYGGTAAA